MHFPRLVLAAVCLLTRPDLPPTRADDGAFPAGDAGRSDEGDLTVSGRVVFPDGSPAAGATVRSVESYHRPRPQAAVAGRNGEFRLRGMFGNGARLHASSADGKQQIVRFTAAGAARKTFETPIELALAPAESRKVTVISAGSPAAGVHVVAVGNDFHSEGLTGADGEVILFIPARQRLREVVAWHPKLGVDGTSATDAAPIQNATTLSLRAPAPYTIRLVDAAGAAIAGVEFGVSVRPENSEWIVSHEVAAARTRTDAGGTAVVPWLPREKLQYVDVILPSNEWKVDDIDRQPTDKRSTIVQVRRRQAVSGKLVMPQGASAEGILISGYGFGPKSNGDIPYARARRDGSFTLRVPSSHAYVLGISDTDWAGPLWSGMILKTDDAEPAEVKIETEAATPATVRVTRGPEKDPVVDTWVEMGQDGMVEFVDESGRTRRGRASARDWIRTDARGEATLGVFRGSQRCRLSSDNWNEDRTIDVTSTDPVVVEFHRKWLADRKVAGRLLQDAVAYRPSPQLFAQGWIYPSPYKLVLLAPQVRADGTFEVTFDAEDVSFVFVDADQRRSAFVQVGPETSAVELKMQPTAVYSGTLLDEKDRPLSNRSLMLSVLRPGKSSPQGIAIRSPDVFVGRAATDEFGIFRFAAVPSEVPLQLRFQNVKDGPYRAVAYSERFFEPGEIRENDRVSAETNRNGEAAAAAPLALAQRVQNVCRDARLNGMHALVILEGDDSTETKKAVAGLLDFEAVKPVLGYLTLRVGADQLKAETGTTAGFGWPSPAAGELMLAALSGEGKTIATVRLSLADVTTAATRGSKFLAAHHPSGRDAASALADAKKTAQAGGRRVWAVLGGPRCGPCFRLARWMDDHHALLERDYVIVKILGGLDPHSEEVFRELNPAPHGIPWFAIVDPDGRILVTSDGPLGNVGFPQSVEDLRHLRRMFEKTSQRLTASEIDGMIKSLAAEK